MILGWFCYFQETISQHFRPKSKKELGQFWLITCPLAVRSLKYSKLAFKKLASTFLGSKSQERPVFYVKKDFCLLFWWNLRFEFVWRKFAMTILDFKIEIWNLKFEFAWGIFAMTMLDFELLILMEFSFYDWLTATMFLDTNSCS